LRHLVQQSFKTNELLTQILAGEQPTEPGAATHLVVTLKQGEPEMPGTITVDTTTAKVTLTFEDDKGDTDAAAPAGLDALVWSSDTGTVTNDATDPLSADISGQVEPSITVTLAPLTVGGVALTEADGVTPFPTPAPLTIPVVAGAATTDSLSASS
jgi:hypothetical protein